MHYKVLFVSDNNTVEVCEKIVDDVYPECPEYNVDTTYNTTYILDKQTEDKTVCKQGNYPTGGIKLTQPIMDDTLINHKTHNPDTTLKVNDSLHERISKSTECLSPQSSMPSCMMFPDTMSLEDIAFHNSRLAMSEDSKKSKSSKLAMGIKRLFP